MCQEKVHLIVSEAQWKNIWDILESNSLSISEDTIVTGEQKVIYFIYVVAQWIYLWFICCPQDRWIPFWIILVSYILDNAIPLSNEKEKEILWVFFCHVSISQVLAFGYACAHSSLFYINWWHYIFKNLISCFIALPRFHQLTEFDQGKRSCRRRLAGHNERRRKPPPSSLLTSRYARLSSSIFG